MENGLKDSLRQNYLTDNKVRSWFGKAGNFLSEAFVQHKLIKKKENFTDILKKTRKLSSSI